MFRHGDIAGLVITGKMAGVGMVGAGDAAAGTGAVSAGMLGAGTGMGATGAGHAGALTAAAATGAVLTAKGSTAPVAGVASKKGKRFMQKQTSTNTTQRLLSPHCDQVGWTARVH